LEGGSIAPGIPVILPNGIMLKVNHYSGFQMNATSLLRSS
jgi:hypothetical protein